MLITIENFGAIKYFQFDTEKDMYLLFGKNSVGKSYAISLVYLILKNILESEKSSLNKYNLSYLIKYTISTDIDDLRKNNEQELDITDYFERHLYLYFSDFFLKKLKDSLINSFDGISNLQNNFTKDKFKIKLEWFNQTVDIDFVINLVLSENNQIIEIEKCPINKIITLKKIKTCRSTKYTNHQIILYCPISKFDSFKQSYNSLFEQVASNSFKNFLPVNDIYYLPASRSGLYQALSAFGQIFAQLANNRSFISKSVQLPAISEPVADYYLNLSNISSNRENYDLKSYVCEIEENILKGNIEFDDKTKKLFFIPNDTSLKLDLSATSSMVSEISPIVSYIKYIFSSEWRAKKDLKTLVFIEEPEAHLHPETQVKLMEVFARMVKDNKIKLVMTSHSNYIFNKASNLVMDNKIDKDKFKAVLFDMTGEGSIARELETDEYGIEDENFIDTAESIYEERIALTNKLNG